MEKNAKNVEIMVFYWVSLKTMEFPCRETMQAIEIFHGHLSNFQTDLFQDVKIC